MKRAAFRIGLLLCIALACTQCARLHAQSGARADSIPAPSAGTGSIRLALDSSPLARYDYKPPVNWWKIGGVTTVSLSTLAASYVYLQTTWWSDRQKSFHFDKGQDLKYALNIDKLGHFYGGAIATDMFYGGLRWADMEEKIAYIYGAVLSGIVQIGIEVKDGFSPRWGFSVYDVGSGMIGSLLPIGRRYIPWMNGLNIKWSYYKPSRHYFDVVNPHGTWNDDYEGQTYWFTYKINDVLPSTLEKIWPDILGVAVGLSLATDEDGKGGGHVEIFLGLDYDLTVIIPSDSAFWEGVKHYLNYIHLPAPAVRISPSVIWFGLYF